ncbi:MAG: cell wall-active antibiotics response protein [Prevotellaceae bacterium]|jgi:predicted membrane protein|nr:cell wall-active antibiotics response protein [Prevotellaceae bacterium]
MKLIKFNNVNVLIGALIIAAGVLLLLFKTGILHPDYQRIIFSWPMILISIGFISLFSRHKWGFSLLLVLIGGFFLLPKLNIEAFGFVNDNRWAIILIIVGIIVIFKSFFEKNRDCCHWETRRTAFNRTIHNKQDTGYVYRECVFGGSKEKIDVKNFKGGKISCVFGEMKLDLSDAELAEGINTLDIRTVFGGVSIYAPADWYIEIRQHQVIGSFEDRRPKSHIEINKEKILIINADMVLGGGEIKYK